MKDTNTNNHNPKFYMIKFSQKAAEIFDLENSYFSSFHKRNGSSKVRKIVGTGFCDVTIGELPVQNNKVLGRI